MKSEELFKELQFLMTKPALMEAVEAVANFSGTLTTTSTELIRQAVMRVGNSDTYKQNGQPFVFAAKFYAQTIAETLAEFNWKFARKQVALGGSTISITGYSFQYTLPSDFVQMIKVEMISSTENYGDWEVAGGFLHSNISNPIIDYICNPASDTSYPAIFKEMVVVRLAYKLAMSLGLADMAQAAQKELEFLVSRPSLQRQIETNSAARLTTAISTKTEICRQSIMRIGGVESFKPGTQPMVFANSFYDHTLEELQSEFPWGFAKAQSSLASDSILPSQGYSRRYALPADFLQLIRINNIDTTENFGQWEIVGGYIHTDLGGGFSVGDEVQFLSLPAGSNLNINSTYLIAATPSSLSFTLSDINKNIIAIANASITPNVTQVRSVTGLFTATVTALSAGVFTFSSPLNQNIKVDYTKYITDVTKFPAPFIEALITRIASKIALPLTGDANLAAAMTAVADQTMQRPTVQILIEKSSKPRATTSANSIAEICRQAILKVGTAEAFKPFGEPMVIAQSLYEQTRNEVLADFDWQFSRLQSSLTSDSTAPAFGYTTRYALPTGTLKVLRVNGIDEDENFGVWEIVGNYLHTNFLTPIKVELTRLVDDTDKFPPVFVNMLIVSLAYKLSQFLEVQMQSKP